ncbi:hypothetical protein [Streptomyces paromomycinus]|uniref:Transcriptional regulator n=1 Tax=Streptomyces paromomycinus TaxID=92743 RepID=A0A401VXF8_STREY|nr:hypothetical protein [Streptomyces paromomycinus]GCD41757.1 transcriptional regulator [Streptomyces paromomycinus]
MPGATRWTGREAELLRQAMRKKGKEFAELVGVNPRQVPRWKRRGETIVLELGNQAGSAFTSPFACAAPCLQNTAYAAMKDNDTGFRCVTAA